MFQRLGQFVARYWILVVLAWCVLLVALRPPSWASRWLQSAGIAYDGAPRWDDITYDGDLAYLPADKPSVQGELILEQAFPQRRSRSQIVLITARQNGPMTVEDVVVANAISRWFHNLQGVVGLMQLQQLDAQAASTDEADPGETEQRMAEREAILVSTQDALEEAIAIDQRMADLSPRTGQTLPRQAAAFHNLSLLQRIRGRSSESEENRRIAQLLDPALAEHAHGPWPTIPAGIPLLDVWDWHDGMFGHKLTSADNRARLVVLQLSNEFMATDNIRVLEFVEDQLQRALEQCQYDDRSGLDVGLSGSAAVGGDLLRAAAESIRNTELVTVVLVILILGVVYRAPLLVLIPLVTIIVSLLVALSLVAALTQLHHLPSFGWWDLKVFTTTRIFIVVILLGAGTDYCLFLISRYREELASGLSASQATSTALGGVGDALAASALTTILGLAMMFFASFGKFTYSGPVIGICLSVTLLACLTLTPAILRACGPLAYWPRRIRTDSERNDQHRPSTRLWTWIAECVLQYPTRILLIAIVLLLPLTIYGMIWGDRVTYDLLAALPQERPSKRGAELLHRHFPVGESGPITILVNRPGAEFDAVEHYSQLLKLCNQFYLPGVLSVRSIADPLGEFPPRANSRDMQFPSIANSSGRRLHLVRAHPRTRELLVSSSPTMPGNVARVEVIIDADPFSPRAIQQLERLEQQLERAFEQKGYWSNAHYALAGVTAGIRDLRDVTSSDTRRIQVLVVAAVLAVLMVILRRPLVCLYLIVTVLISYYFTLGCTQWFFANVYGDQFRGLDWKTPIFLFVILVAVGQDYNVYLATRVFEEQRRRGAREGLKQAIIHTGGIITSCGVIMAGTFVSMTAGTWTHVPLIGRFIASQGALQGIVELGFALSLGILIDTFVVRTVLAPAFLALFVQRQLANQRRGRRDEQEAAYPSA